MMGRTIRQLRRGGAYPKVAAIAFLLVAFPAQATGPTPKDVKIGVYVEMINGESNFVFDNEAGYEKWVADPSTGPTCKEVGLRGPSSPTAADRYAHYSRELAKAPKLEVDAAAVQMVEALEQLHAPVQEASDYYFSGKYNQDGCKRGKELHPLLMAGWAKYERADAVVRSYVEKYTDERDAAELGDVLRRFGKRLHYYHQKLLVDSKALVRIAEAQIRAEHPDTA